MTWTIDGNGTQTATIGTEHILDTPSTSATYEFAVDLVNLANGDVVELRIYDKIDGTNLRQIWKGTFSNVQVNAPKLPPTALPSGGQFTLKQTAGTGRNFPWRVARI